MFILFTEIAEENDTPPRSVAKTNTPHRYARDTRAKTRISVPDQRGSKATNTRVVPEPKIVIQRAQRNIDTELKTVQREGKFKS